MLDAELSVERWAFLLRCRYGATSERLPREAKPFYAVERLLLRRSPTCLPRRSPATAGRRRDLRPLTSENWPAES
jgi:hypothetical protein